MLSPNGRPDEPAAALAPSSRPAVVGVALNVAA
jgi:hypothetical protein